MDTKRTTPEESNKDTPRDTLIPAETMPDELRKALGEIGVNVSDEHPDHPGLWRAQLVDGTKTDLDIMPVPVIDRHGKDRAHLYYPDGNSSDRGHIRLV